MYRETFERRKLSGYFEKLCVTGLWICGRCRVDARLQSQISFINNFDTSWDAEKIFWTHMKGVVNCFFLNERIPSPQVIQNGILALIPFISAAGTVRTPTVICDSLHCFSCW